MNIRRSTCKRPAIGPECNRFFRFALVLLVLGAWGAGVIGAQAGTQRNSNAAGQEGSPSTAGQEGNASQAQSTSTTDQSTSNAPAQAGGAPAGAAANGAAPAGAAPAGAAPAAEAPSAKAPVEAPGRNEIPEASQPVPYPDMPSLTALYTQVAPPEAKPQRFGSEAFVFGTGNAEKLPEDLPVGPDFVLGPGDNVVVNMWGSQPQRLVAMIDRQGQITVPEAGAIAVSGMTIAQAQDAIQSLLNTQFKDEKVELSLGRVHTVRIYVVGDVQRPGAYDVSSLSSPLGALYAAGGPTSLGSLRILRQYRGKDLVREIDLYDFLLKGIRSGSERLLAGDTLLVPPAGAEVTVEGMVHHPAIYELNGEQTLSDVLNLAGGVRRTASLKEIKVQRIVAHERRTMIDLQLHGDPAAVKQQMDAFKVQGGDDVIIGQILPYVENQVFLEGHVYRPGMYPYREGMTISDLLPSYQAVLPEAADHGELIRLVPPDYHPETIFFDVHDALIGNISIPLQPFDMIRIFGRYQLDAPRVSIEGEVLRPGDYPMSQGMTVTALVKMAGGFKRDAYRAEADLSSYEVQDGKKVLVDHTEINLEKALEGDASADAVLRAGDVVSIRQLAGWQDIGATVSVEGEVQHPGTYTITPGERLSEVLKRAGGFRPGAYPSAAVLTRNLVKQLEEEARQQMIRRLENTPIQTGSGSVSMEAAAAQMESLQRQREQALTALRTEPLTGRLVIHISSDVSRWENTPDDIELRPGDNLNVPKRPNFVIVSGEVFNPAAISYSPGKNLNWYLKRTGGPTRVGDMKEIYVLHADGSVTPRGNGWDASIGHMRMRPGDDIFVPEKVTGTSMIWQNIIGVAQLASAAALPLAIAGTF